MAQRSNHSGTKKDVQQRQRTWLREVLDSHGLKPSQLATGTGSSPSTLSRFLNDENYKGTLTPETIERIKTTLGIPGPDELASARRLSLIGMEANPFDRAREPATLTAAVDAILRSRQDVSVWRLQAMALEQVGYLPGDIMFVESITESRPPRPQDVVCANVMDYRRGTPETIWRVYDPPYLIGAALDRTAYKPILIDGDRVRLSGVVRESFRPHGLAETR